MVTLKLSENTVGSVGIFYLYSTNRSLVSAIFQLFYES